MCCIIVVIDQIRLITKTNLVHVVCCNLIQLVLVQLFTHIKVQGNVNTISFGSRVLFNQLIKPCEFVREPQLWRLANKVRCINALGYAFFHFFSL
jgi:hypothetical protein